ncbi:MAG: hypothetical protein WD226_02400 [Planctomycetota bacterium]
MMSFLCNTLRLRLGCTWVVKTAEPAVRWNTTDGQGQLEMTGTGEPSEPAQWLQCTVCGKRKDAPTRAEVQALLG